MTEQINQGMDGVKLRRRAEDRLGENAGTKPHSAPGTGAEPLQLLHELQVHQIELEMQNTELRQVMHEREATEQLLGKYTDLYDLAPVGYITLTSNGEIRAVNLTCSGFLGIERSRLVRRRFQQFVADNDLPSFNTFLDSIFESKGKHTCELTLLKEGGQRLFVRMEAVAAESGNECRLMFIDISELKRVQEELNLKIIQLETALTKVKQLEGYLPICVYCKKIRDDKESWHQLEKYITEHSEAIFTHGACPECYERVTNALKTGKFE